MNIGLVDVDGHNYPNLALMKISAYHKSQGDNVSWADMFGQYDIVYKSKVFTFTQDDTFAYDAKQTIKGGTGYNLDSTLPDHIEHIMPDYSLYGITDTAYGYLTRGCPRNCPFCIVGKKEGLKSRKVADLSEFWNGQKNIELLDPNLLACKDRLDLLEQVAESGAMVNYNQGLDIRFVTDKVLTALNKTRYKIIHFAWDNYGDKIAEKKLEQYAGQFNKADVVVYVLTNFNTTQEQDLYRIYKLRELGYMPYVTIFEKWTAPPVTIQMQRWVNSRFVWRNTPRFEDYKAKKTPEKDDRILELF